MIQIETESIDSRTDDAARTLRDTTPVRTPPLLLRPWHPDDAPALRAAIDESLAELRPWISWASREPTTVPELRERLAEYADDFAQGRRWRYAIVERGTGELLGGASLHPYPGPGALEVGYWVRSTQVRRGIVRAAATALALHAFRAHGVERVEIWCDLGNVPSMRVAEALGFTHTGRRTIARPDGTPREVEVYTVHAPAQIRPLHADVAITDD